MTGGTDGSSLAVSGPLESGGDVTLPGVGSILGRYHVIRRLGAGGMGQVFAAKRDDHGEPVALKHIALADPRLLVRFKHEFRSLADMTHPNLVRLGELVVLASSLAFYTMELVEGQSLLRWIRRGTPAGTAPNIARLCHATRQLAAGVAHLHRAGRIHRDLKPSNVMVTDEGRVVILDFGLVLEIGEHDPRITGAGQLVGTPAYMAPEQGSRDTVGPAVDLYALGVTLFEALTGCMPFVGSAIRVLLNKQHAPAPDPRELAEGIPDWLAQLCRALLDPTPEHRPSAEQLIATLDAHVPAAARAALDDAVGVQLFGRAAELERLSQAYEQVAEHGGATVVCVLGPPGRGKTALVDHFLDGVRGSSSVVLRGRAHPRESVPYKGLDSLVDAVAVFLRSLPEVELAQLRPRHLRELYELFPVLAGIWAEPGRRGNEGDPVVRRKLGVAALREILVRLGDEATIVAVVDDFHWADLDGFAVLGELLLPPEPPAIMLLLAYNPEADGPIVAALDDPDVLRGARRIALRLEPLAAIEAEALARSLIDARLVDDVETTAQQLAAGCAGEPLALVRAATARKPGDVSELADDEIIRRILALSELARELLELATIADERLANELALAVLGCNAERFDMTVRELVVAGMLAAIALEPGGVIKLARPRIAALLRVESDTARTSRLHVGLAEVLVARRAESELIAGHFEAGGAIDRAREFMTRAACDAAEALAFVRAERLFRRAIELLERSAESTPGARGRSTELDDEAHVLRLALADQLSNLACSHEAAEIYAERAERGPPEQRTELRRRAAEQYAISGWSQLALPLLRELMRDAGERLPTTRLGALLLYVSNSLRLALRGRSVREWPQPGGPPVELRERFELLHAATMALQRSGAPLFGMALRPHALRLAYETGDRTALANLLVHEAVLFVTFGRFDRAWRAFAEIEELIAPSDDPLAAATLHMGRHFYSARLAQVEQSEAMLAQAMRCLDQLPGRNWQIAVAFHTHTILLRRAGAYRRLLDALPGWLATLHDFGQRHHESLLHGEEVMILAQLGQPEAARRSLERGRTVWKVEFYTFSDYLLGIAEVWLLLAEHDYLRAKALAQTTEADMFRHGYRYFKLPRTRVNETRLWAELLFAIANDDASLAPRERELRRLRRCGLPQYATGALILSAGVASLHGQQARAGQLWREALHACEPVSMRGYAAAVRMRLSAQGVEDADELRAKAQVYFEAEQIADVDGFVALMAPARST